MKFLTFSVTGARIVNDTSDLREEDVGTQTDLFEITKVGDEVSIPNIIFRFSYLII